MDCSLIGEGGSCSDPKTSINHASVAMNLFYQKNKRQDYDCYFNNSGLLVITDPSKFLIFFFFFIIITSKEMSLERDLNAFFRLKLKFFVAFLSSQMRALCLRFNIFILSYRIYFCVLIFMQAMVIASMNMMNRSKLAASMGKKVK